MVNGDFPQIQIALVGGGSLCKEVLEKTVIESPGDYRNAQIKAVSDPDASSPGIKLARRLGLITVKDYRKFYSPDIGINLLILLSPEKELLDDILKNKPSDIRVLSYDVFRLFWETLHAEERRLREKAEELETILNGIQDFILVITPERVILSANKAFLDSMGYSKEDVVGKKCHDVFQKGVYPCSQENVACPLYEAIRNKRPSQQILTRADHKGRTKYIEVTIFPIWENEGKILKFIEVSRDITHRKEEEERITRKLEKMVEERTRQLKETHAKLLHKDKMASLGKLAASVVHEINNPIAGILNLNMLIQKMTEADSLEPDTLSRFRYYLSLMETEIKRVSRIVSNLLAFSKQSKIELKPFDINKLIEKTLFLNANFAKINRVTIEKRLDEGLPLMVGSEDQLQQVFVNLISNAVEAMTPTKGGTLSISTEFVREKNQVKIEIRDTGVGIPKEHLSRLFEPFFTTKKKGHGVGLGLSLVYGIVEEHGGTIEVESEEGKGSVFKLILPLQANPSKRSRNGGLNEWHDKNSRC